jgi:hypothetical protein
MGSCMVINTIKQWMLERLIVYGLAIIITPLFLYGLVENYFSKK